MTRARAARAVAALAAVALVLSGCGFKGLYTTPLPGGADLGNHPYSMTMYFSDVLDLVPQSAVKVNDVAVGKVTSIALKNCSVSGNAVPTWCAEVKVSVNDSVKLPSNATAEVKQTSLLGEKYVSLDQPTGAPAATNLRDGSVIKYQDTTSAPEVEEVLGALSLLLNDGGVQQIQTIASELNSALKGHEGAIRDLLNQLNSFVGTLDAQKDKITNALVSINKLAATLNRQKKIITDALDNFPAALKVLSDERVQLVGLLKSLSHLGTVATTVVNATAGTIKGKTLDVEDALTDSLKKLSPAVEQLTAAGASLPNALKIAGTFPFPLGTTREFVKGDYANLALSLDLNLNDELCGLAGSVPILGTLCKGTSSQSATPLTPSSAAAAPLTPMIVGSGK